MLEIERKSYIFRTKQIWFSDSVYDVEGYANVRFSGCKSKLYGEGFKCKEGYTSVIDLTQGLDEIWGDMEPKSCRYAIRRAARDSVKITINQDYEEFYQIYKSFSKQRGLPGLEKLDTIKKYGTLFTAQFNGEILGGHVYLHDADTIMYWLAATKRLGEDRERRSLIGNASHLLHWEAIQYAKEKGFKEFDMGSLFAKDGKDYPGYSIDAFKRGFGGKVISRYQYSKDYSKIYTIARFLYSLLRR